MTPYSLLGFSVALIEAVPTLVQARHSRQHGVAGLDPSTHTAWVLSWVLWCAYGVAIGEVPVVIHNGIGFAASMAVFHLLWQHRAVPARTIGVLLGVHVAIAILMLSHLEVGVVVLAAADACFVVPQIRTAWRQRDLSGVSQSAYRFGALIDVAWIVYAFGVGHPLAAAWPCISLLFSGAVLFRVVAVRRGEARQHDA